MLAERHFTVNQSSEDDEKGWDFLITFPEHNWEGETPYDSVLRAAEPKCWVQVKTTTTDKKRTSFPLHHWKRFATYPDPCFFYILECDDADRFTAAYLVHVGQQLVEEVGERWFHLTDEERAAANAKDKGITWSSMDELPLGDADALREQVVSFTGRDPDKYAREKRRWRNEAGLPEAGSHQLVTWTLSANGDANPMEILRDHVLGYLDGVEPDHLEIKSEERWGERSVLHSYSKGRLEFEYECVRGVLELSIPATSRRAAIEVDIYSTLHPAVKDAFPEGVSWTRFASPLLDFVLDTETRRVSIEFSGPDPVQPMPLHDLASCYGIATLLRDSADTGESFEIAGVRDGQYLPFGTGEMDENLELPALVMELLQLADCAQGALQAFRVGTDVSCAPLHLLSQKSQILLAASLTAPNSAFSPIKITGEHVGCDDGTPLAFPLVIPLQFEQYDLILAGAIGGVAKTAEVEGERQLEFEAPFPVLIDHRVSRCGNRVGNELFGDMYAAIEEWAASEGRGLLKQESFIAEGFPSLPDWEAREL